MMLIGNKNSNGFFRIKGKNSSGNNIDVVKHDVGCSQVIRQTSEGDISLVNGTITFYYPSDWLIREGRNKVFFEYWIKLANTFFCEVNYVGKQKSETLGINFDVIKQWSRGVDAHHADDRLRFDLGNHIRRDSWEVFEMSVSGNNYEKQRRNYCAYCMIRYLFSGHYNIVVSTFLRIMSSLKGVAVKDIDEFVVLQMAHYYFSGYTGYNKTYTLVEVMNRDARVKKAMSLAQFNGIITDVSASINAVFSSRQQVEGLSVDDFQRMLEQNKIKELYDKIK